MYDDKTKIKYLTFVIDDKIYAIPILSLTGIVGNPKTIQIKDPIDSIVGIFNTNGFNIPLFDLRLILNKPNVISPTKTCVLVVRAIFKGQEKLVGFIVDSLSIICHFHPSEIKKLSAYNENEFIEGVAINDEKMFMILALEKIINRQDIIRFLNEFWNYEDDMSKTDKKGV